MSIRASPVGYDEAHHAIANSYVRLCQFYPNAKVLGVTATPWRLSGEGFGRVFDSFIPSMPISEFMRQGWLAPYDYYSIDSGSSVSSIVDGIKDCDISGDYKVKAMEQALDVDHIRVKLLHSYMKYVSGKKGIIYSISRVHSEHICSKYQSVGVRIVSIDSETPAKQREQYVADFKNGKIDVIVNVDIFSEGFDCPNIEFVQLARPTKSLVKYIQQVGRGLRVNGGKRCIILDNVGMYTRFGLPDVDHPWQEYFEGTSMQEQSNNCKSIKVGKSEIGGCDKNLEEGEDDMVLIQALKEANDLNINIESEQNAIVKNLSQHIPEKGDYKVIAYSAPFFSSKFQIEETSDGYYAVNLKTGTRKFLLNYPTYRAGTIKLLRESQNVYKVLRCSILVIGMKEKQTIIGQIRKDGGLVKFKPQVGEELEEIPFY